MLDERFAHLAFAFILFVPAFGVLFRPVQPALRDVDIRQDEFQIQCLRIPGGIRLLQKDLLVVKTADDLHQCVCLPDHVQKLVSFSVSLPDTGDVHEFDGGRGVFFRMIVFCKPVKPLIRDLCHPDVRLGAGIRVSAGLGFCSGKRIEERRLPDVRKSYDP